MSAGGVKPQDGPATVFEVDPYIPKLRSYSVSTKLDDDGDTVNERKTDEDCCGLVLVTGWPPSEDVRNSYVSFQNEVKKCFNDSDLSTISFPPAAYLYPVECLHVTIATLHPFTVNLPTKDNHRSSTFDFWTNDVLHAASQQTSWPDQPLELRVSHAQIGTRAGILLWEETTGGLEAMRACIQDEASRAFRMNREQGGNGDNHSLEVNFRVPNIIHSTFLRFGTMPSTNGNVMQQKFQTFVIPKLKSLFPERIMLNEVKLVYEAKPYMHIPNDNNHVVKTISLLS